MSKAPENSGAPVILSTGGERNNVGSFTDRMIAGYDKQLVMNPELLSYTPTME
jgi:hypothetical protein